MTCSLLQKPPAEHHTTLLGLVMTNIKDDLYTNTARWFLIMTNL